MAGTFSAHPNFIYVFWHSVALPMLVGLEVLLGCKRIPGLGSVPVRTLVPLGPAVK